MSMFYPSIIYSSLILPKKAFLLFFFHFGVSVNFASCHLEFYSFIDDLVDLAPTWESAKISVVYEKVCVQFSGLCFVVENFTFKT